MKKRIAFRLTKEHCYEEALKYKTRSEFKEKSSGAYSKCYHNGWLYEACSHMINKIHVKKNTFTKEYCHDLALRCKTRSEFSDRYHSAHSIAAMKGWLAEITTHLPIQGLKHYRFNYVYKFPDNHAYIGLTYNMEIRNRQHLTEEKSSVFKHIRKTGLKPLLVCDDLKSVESAIQKESEMCLEYEKNGWILLNQKNRVGLIGGSGVKWTEEKCREEALKYKTKNEFRVKSSGAYFRSKVLGIFDEITNHYESGVTIKWPKEKCHEEALKYNSRSEFQKKSSPCYQAAHSRKWLDDICSHMANRRCVH